MVNGLDDAALDQLRGQMWRLNEQVAETDRRAHQRAAEVESKLLRKIEEIEKQVHEHDTWIANQRTRHASTPVWLFGLVGIAGTVFTILSGLYAMGLIWR